MAGGDLQRAKYVPKCLRHLPVVGELHAQAVQVWASGIVFGEMNPILPQTPRQHDLQ